MIIFIIVIFIILPSLIYFLVIKKRGEKHEKFVVNKDADKFLFANNGVEKCSILDVKNHENVKENADSYLNIKTLIESGRIKKFKPNPFNNNTNIKPDKVYCYIDNDGPNKTRDILFNNKSCDLGNSYFKDNKMITNVFEDIQKENAYRLPTSKCVFEIDPNFVNESTLNDFYSRFDEGVTCKDKITSLVEKRTIDDDKFNSLSKAYEYVDSTNKMLMQGINTLRFNNNECNTNLDRNKRDLESNTGLLSRNEKLRDDFFKLDNICKEDLLKAEEDRNTRINFYTTENDKLDKDNRIKQFTLDECREENREREVEYDKYNTVNNDLNKIKNEVNQDKVTFTKEYETCLEDLKKVTKERIKNIDDFEYCDPFTDKLKQCDSSLNICREELNICIPKRDKNYILQQETKKTYEDCVSTLDVKKDELKQCNRRLTDLLEENKILSDNINKKSIVRDELSNELQTCVTDTEATNKEVLLVQNTNTDLYNDLNRYKSKYNDDVNQIVSNITSISMDSNSITNMQKKVTDVKKQAEVQNKLKDYGKAECMVGMKDCAMAEPKSMDNKILGNIAYDIENEQYCAEKCVNVDGCKAIYFKDKKCYLMNTEYNPTDRIITETSGYSANFMPSYRVNNCPDGVTGCMYAKGISTKPENVLSNDIEVTIDDCIHSCIFFENCRSFSYSQNQKVCTLFNKFYDEYNPSSEPKRYTINDNAQVHTSGNLTAASCLKTEFGPWSECTNPDEDTCIGIQTRTKPSGGWACPAITETNHCKVQIRSQADADAWSLPENGDCASKSRRRKWKNVCTDDTIEDVVDNTWEIELWQDNNRRGKYAKFNCKNAMRMLLQKEEAYYFQTNFGPSSWSLKGPATFHMTDNKDANYSWFDLESEANAKGDIDARYQIVKPKTPEGKYPFNSYPAPKQK